MLEDPFRDEQDARREQDEARLARAYWRRVAMVIVLAVVLGLAAAGAMRKAFGAEERVLVDCQKLAETIDAFVDFRDTGARLELVLELVGQRSTDGPALRAVLEREIRRMWQEGLAGEHAAAAVFQRCHAVLGEMMAGPES